MNIVKYVAGNKTGHSGCKYPGSPAFDRSVARDILFIIRADLSRKQFNSRTVSLRIGGDIYIIAKYISELARIGAIKLVKKSHNYLKYKCNFQDDDIERIIKKLERRYNKRRAGV